MLSTDTYTDTPVEINFRAILPLLFPRVCMKMVNIDSSLSCRPMTNCDHHHFTYLVYKNKPQVSQVMIYSQCTFHVSRYEWHAVLCVGYQSRDLLRRQFIYWNVFRYWKLVPCIILVWDWWDLKPHIFIWQSEFGEGFCRKGFVMLIFVLKNEPHRIR